MGNDWPFSQVPMSKFWQKSVNKCVFERLLYQRVYGHFSLFTKAVPGRLRHKWLLGPSKGYLLNFLLYIINEAVKILIYLILHQNKIIIPPSNEVGGGGGALVSPCLFMSVSLSVCGKNGFGLITLLILDLQCWYFIRVVSMHWGGHFLIFGSKGQRSRSYLELSFASICLR